MNRKINRRDFLKLAGLLPLSLAAEPLTRFASSTNEKQSEQQNVLVVVFDAFSSYNISLYGYPRETTPNINRLSERAVRYHNHYAGGNFTTPGTASLLTGVLPWTHRAFQPAGTVTERYVNRNLFSAFKDYYPIAYSHNGWVNILLYQFLSRSDELIPRDKLLLGSDELLHILFRNDDDIASVSWLRDINVEEQGYAYSLFLSRLYQEYQEKKFKDLKHLFPLGLPTAGSAGSDNIFLLENAVDYLANRLTAIPQPFVGYFHFLPPHDPYRPPTEFYKHFHNDGFKPPKKPKDIFAKRPPKDILAKRAEYDEFILYVDREFGRLYEKLESAGLLENTWLVLTSDHGELNERGITGHSTEVLYEPVIRVPLMIFEPGRKTGMDILENTSAVDVIPTLTHVTGQPFPDWVEGGIPLPPYGSGTEPTRNIFTVRASKNGQYDPLSQASVMMVKGNHKLHYYFGYSLLPEMHQVKLFDVKADPEELNDLSPSQKNLTDTLLDEIMAKLDEVNKPYQ
ncbi:MAG: sulfatase-like hydrolase/transferase [Anaerolineales bacterium]|nr:sulfatase-like hydrolase/transferase [Anaerolineales bacterium]